MELKVKKLHKDAKLPTHGHPGDAGLDFYALEEVRFPPNKQMRVHTGLAVEIPDGYVGLVWDKSSISFNFGLKAVGGVIDASYRGELVMSMLNMTDKEVIIEKGHKIVQMLIQKFEHCDIVETEEVSATVRGEGREGSTGLK